MTSPVHPPVVVLIATRDRLALLRARSLPSLARQSHRPALVVLVNDGTPWSPAEVDDLRGRLLGIPLRIAPNERAHGVAGAWNTGLSLLRRNGFAGFVAILDDDDEWDADHLRANFDAAARHGANIVVSGLRVRNSAGEMPRPLITALRDRDFLTGNPGWQGSNTFVSLPLLTTVGDFREQLRSLNDRDLAIRLLRHPEARPVLVPQWTATWRIDNGGRLSDRRGTAKLAGLRQFWAWYAAEMTDEERRAYLRRAEDLFGFSEEEVCDNGVRPVRGLAMSGGADAAAAEQL